MRGKELRYEGEDRRGVEKWTKGKIERREARREERRLKKGSRIDE